MSSVSHDDAARAVVGALVARAGTYNVVDDGPMRRREFVDSLAEVLGVGAPRLPAPWMKYLFGSLGEMLARSVRISNHKLRAECAGCQNIRACAKAGGRSRLRSRRRSCVASGATTISAPLPGLGCIPSVAGADA